MGSKIKLSWLMLQEGDVLRAWVHRSQSSAEWVTSASLGRPSPPPNTAVPVSVTRLFQIHPPVASTKWTTRSSLLYGQQSNSDQPMNHVASFYNG